MKSVSEHIRSHLLASAGVPAVDWGTAPDPCVTRREQWSPEFVRLMRNRLTFGFYRYGSNNPGDIKPAFDLVGGAIERIKRYVRDGNQEHLIDAANLCMVEFMIPTGHRNPSLKVSDDGAHVRRL